MKSKVIAACLRLLAWVPLGLSRALGKGLGLVWWRLNNPSVQVTRKNLALCFADMDAKAREDLVRRSLVETVRMGLETPAVWYRSDAWRESKVVAWENPELFDAALADEAGLLLLLPHFGNWEMAGMLAARRAPTTAIYREPRLAALDPILRDARQRATTVPATSRGVGAVLKALNKGEMTIVLPDQEPNWAGGVFSPFYGVSALTMTLVCRLLAKTQARALVAYARRAPGGFVIGFQEPDAAIYSSADQASVDALNRSIETLVQTAPEQYQWEYKRFRKRPPGEAKLYRF